ncbi:MAG: hypothetical protein KDN22_26205 [Verrucomicrobiae bacterium]|nr:hypothetical protein [Verrucomicrobiae bacterium]
MKANPGGQIDTNAVIGRSAVIELLWDTLEQQSIIKTAERRIGKTTIAKKMLAEPRPGWRPVLQDLEQYHSAMDFAMSVYREVHQFLSNRGKATRLAKALVQSIGGVEVGGVFKMPEMASAQWKDVLRTTISDLMNERSEGDDRLVFLWDEMPFMLANIRDREGAPTAMEVLDVLRALRQDHPGLRMVITGSIGLHHVLGSLKKANYANASVNDMLEIEVLPLESSDAVSLAMLLLEGEALVCAESANVAEVIAHESDCFPFYIHHIVKGLKIAGGTVDSHRVREMVKHQLTDEKDPWELYHYRERIPIYYGDDAKTVLLILDDLAVRSESMSVADLLGALKNVSGFDDREALLSLLKLLVQDHYLSRDSNGAYQFRFPLIKRWWKINRSL